MSPLELDIRFPLATVGELWVNFQHAFIAYKIIAALHWT